MPKNLCNGKKCQLEWVKPSVLRMNVLGKEMVVLFNFNRRLWDLTEVGLCIPKRFYQANPIANLLRVR